MSEDRHSILVVDDNEGNRDLLSRRLEKKGYSVLLAEDGQRALEILDKEQVDLVLLDIMMPGMNGIEVLEVIRKTRSAAELPVIMATAKTESEDVVLALDKGANDYVTKPLDFPIVLARVQAQLRTKRAWRPQEPAPAPENVSLGEIRPGVVVAGKYRLESRLGSGSFGTVYQATHLDLDHSVAVKILQASMGTNPEAVARFRTEGVSACRVRHPNAVSVLDFGVTPSGVAFLVMELLDGQSLLDELQKRGTLSPARSAEILIPVCEVLSAAHRAGVIHRDIKPSNIFLQRTPRGEVPKVLDFGIAKMAGEATVGQNLTVDGSILGTPAYMAPERLRAQPYDGKADVYALGITLYQMLGGRLPFVAPLSDPMAVVMMQISDPPPPLRSVNPRVPAIVEAVVMQALRKNPDERPTAEALARNLARAAGIEVEEGRPAPGVGEAAPEDPTTQFPSQGNLTTIETVETLRVEAVEPTLNARQPTVETERPKTEAEPEAPSSDGDARRRAKGG